MLSRKNFCAVLCAFTIIFLLASPDAFAQPAMPDSNYYVTYPAQKIFRIYLSRKFAPFTISSNNPEDLNYKTNSKLNLGAGFSYKIITINFAYGFNFLNKDKGRGDTKGFDLQLHAYPKKWVVDALGTFLRGYYLDPKANNGLHLSDYYQRPDLHRNIIGLSLFRVANYNKFSYRAAFNQKDVQIKSAGSLLYGASTYYGIVKADSSFVPVAAGSNYTQAGVSAIHFFNIGTGVGYAYSLIIHSHFFITGSAIVTVNLNISDEEKGNTFHKIKILPGAIYKAAIGYNTKNYSVSAVFLGDALYTSSSFSYKEYFVPTGTVNFIVAKKF